MLSVGTQLKKARERKNLTVEEAARALNLRAYYLHELENDHPELLPSPAQARGFVRLLARHYGLDAQALLAQWDAPVQQVEIGKKPEITQKPKVQRKKPVVEEKTKAARENVENVGLQARALLRSILMQIHKPFDKITAKISQGSLPPKEKQGKQKAQTQSASEPQPVSNEQPPRADGKTSDELLRELGAALRGRRETLGLSIADVERFTMLKRFYLEALEAGRIEELPSTVQGRGMLSNYADFLAMKNDQVLGIFADALQRRREERTIPRTTKQPSVLLRVNLPESWRRILNPDLIFGSVLIIGLFLLIFIGTARIFINASAEPTDAPSIAQMLQVTPTPLVENTPTPQETSAPEVAPAAPPSIPTPTIIPTVNAAPLQVYIITNQRVFLRVSVDGKSAYNGRTTPQGAYTFSGNQNIQLECGNADGLEIYFNQEYLGKLGGVGEVIRMTFTLQGVQKTSPLLSPTPQPESTPPANP